MSSQARTITAIVAVLTLIAGVAGVVTRQPDDTYEVTAHFTRAIGLFPRSTVRVLGVEVGRVTEVVPEGDRVRVGMRIRDDVRIPEDARALIIPISLISDRYVQLEPVWTSGPALTDGDEIPVERGVVPAELDDLLATLKDFLEALEPGTVDEPGALGRFVVNADAALDGQGEALGTTIESLGSLLDTLGRNADSFDATLVSLDRIFGSLAQRDAAIAATNRGLASVFSALAEERESLGSGIVNLGLMVDEIGRLVRTHRSRLEADLTVLADTTDVVIRRRDEVLRNIIWLPVLAEGAARAKDDANDRVIVRDNQQVRED